MTLDQFFPFWKELTPAQQETLTRFVTRRSVKKGTILHNGSSHPVNLTPHKRLSCLRSR